MTEREFTPYTGGPLPDLAPGTRIDVQFRCGGVVNAPYMEPDPDWYPGRGEASAEYWKQDGMGMDIVAWRLAE